MKFFKYSLISFISLLIATFLFYFCKAYLNTNAYYSNLIGDGIALMIVFIYSWHFIFEHKKKYFKRKLIFNTISKIIVIYLLSLTLFFVEKELLLGTYFFFNKIFSKELILSFVKICLAPLSLILNYLSSYFIVEKTLNN